MVDVVAGVGNVVVNRLLPVLLVVGKGATVGEDFILVHIGASTGLYLGQYKSKQAAVAW